MVRCPVCRRSELKTQIRKAEQYGFDLGEYKAAVCSACGEIFWLESDVRRMEKKAKRLGIWGLEQKTKVAVAGNSLIVRIPKRLANFVGITKGKEVYVHPAGRDRLLIEEAGKRTS